MSPSAFRRKKQSVEPSDDDKDSGAVFPIMSDDGTVEWYRTKTGEPVDAPLNPAHYRPYNKNDAELIGQGIAKGLTVRETLDRLSIPRSTYNKWRRERPEFSAIIESGRRLRAEDAHESMAGEIRDTPVSVDHEDPANLDGEDLALMDARNKARLGTLKVLEKKQSIVQRMVKDDAPQRFGVQRQVIEAGQDGQVLSLGLAVPDEWAALIKERFSPKLDNSGGLSVAGLNSSGESDTIESDGKKTQGQSDT